MANDVPQHFDRAFLRWFQERTEETWQKYQTRTFESFVAARVGGSDWQQGTRWLGGLEKEDHRMIIKGKYSSNRTGRFLSGERSSGESFRLIASSRNLAPARGATTLAQGALRVDPA